MLSAGRDGGCRFRVLFPLPFVAGVRVHSRGKSVECPKLLESSQAAGLFTMDLGLDRLGPVRA